MKNKTKVLFVCIHNCARSQMAEAFLNELGGERFEAKSAGIEPGMLNPYVVQVMNKIGFDISENKVKDVLISSRREQCLALPSRSATKQAQRDARFSPGTPQEYTGVSLTRQ